MQQVALFYTFEILMDSLSSSYSLYFTAPTVLRVFMNILFIDQTSKLFFTLATTSWTKGSLQKKKNRKNNELGLKGG